MARINIESQFWTDVMEVAARMGDSDKAVGQALKLIKYAQEEYKKGKRIPVADFRAKFSEHLMPEFARIDGDHIVVSGAEKFFGWLDAKKEAGKQGGVKSGKVRRSKTKQTEAKRSKPKQTEPSSSSSSSLSSSSSSSHSSISNSSNSTPKVSDFVAAYCDRFKIRWGDNPQILQKDAGIAKRLAKDLSLDRFTYLLDAYFQMPDAWLVKIKHPLATFETKLNEIVVFAESGKFTTNREVRQADDMATTYQLLKKIESGDQ
jgi:hypothetical protein